MSLNQVLCYTTPDSPLIATLEMDGWSFEDGGYTGSISSITPTPHPNHHQTPITSRKVAAYRTSTSARASVSRSAIELTSAAPSPGRPTAPPTGHSPGSASRCGSCSDVEASRAGQELSAAASSRKWERVRQQRRQGTVNPVCVVVLGSLGLDHRSGFGLGKVNVAGSKRTSFKNFASARKSKTDMIQTCWQALGRGSDQRIHIHG